MTQDTRNMGQRGYRKFVVWQRADELAYQIYLITKKFPKDELFGLVSQMRRAAVSVPANIAEGYGRASQKERVQFYVIARGSLTELEYFIDFSLRCGYITAHEHAALVELRDDAGRLLNGFIRSTRSYEK